MGNGKNILINNKQVFLLALREGLGFSHACSMSRNHPKTMTEAILDSPDFKNDCDNAVLGASVDLLKMSSDFMSKHNYRDALETKKLAKACLSLVLWESVAKRADVKPPMVVEQFIALGSGKEVAVALGFEYDDYVKYLMQHQAITTMIESLTKAK